MQDFLNKSIQSVVGKYIGTFFTAIYSILLVNMLGQEAYGIYTVIFLLPTIITSVGAFGLGPSIIFHINHLKTDSLSFFKYVILFATAISIIYLSIYNYFSSTIINYINSPSIDNKMIYLSSLTIPTLLFRKYTRAFLRGFYRIKETIFVENIICPIFMLVGIIIVSLKDYSLHFFIILPAITNLIATFSMVFFLRNNLFNTKNQLKKFAIKDFRKLLSFGIKGHVGAILQKINLELILLIITPNVKINEIGMLSLAMKILNIFRGVIDSFVNVLAPKVSKSNLEQILIIIPRLTRFLSLYLILLWPFLWFSLPILTPIIYGNEFVNMDSYFNILMPGVTTISLTNIILLSLTFTGSPQYKSYARLSGFIFSLSFLILFMDQLGIIAALISISGGYIIATIVSTFFIWKVHKISIARMIFIKKEDFKYLRKSIIKN